MRLSDGEYNGVLAEVKKFLVTVYESAESIYGQFGELGIDFALDATLKLWLIECNAKSAKMALILSSDEETIRQVFLNPLEYAKYIAK
jgi:KaiC/GvpD/RAD55 family RecA-like ATPase